MAKGKGKVLELPGYNSLVDNKVYARGGVPVMRTKGFDNDAEVKDILILRRYTRAKRGKLQSAYERLLRRSMPQHHWLFRIAPSTGTRRNWKPVS